MRVRGNINGSGEIREKRLVRESDIIAAVIWVDGPEEDVVWFDIAVDDASDLMQPVQAGDQLLRELLVRSWALNWVEHCGCYGLTGTRGVCLAFDVCCQ